MISAAFTVVCTPAVSGRFVSWTVNGTGGLACGRFDAPGEPFERQARQHCSRTPGPRPSGPDEPALPLDPDVFAG